MHKNYLIGTDLDASGAKAALYRIDGREEVPRPITGAGLSGFSLAAIGERINFFGGLTKVRTDIHFDSNLK